MSSSTVRRSSSSVTRSCASAAQAHASIAGGWRPGRRGELGGRQAGRAGFAETGEQTQLDAEVDEPRAVEPAEAGDQVVESVVEGHRRPIVACWNAAMGAGRVP